MCDFFTNDIDTVIFDIGNVLIKFAWRECLLDLGYKDESFERLANDIFLNEDWDAGDSGLVTTEEWLNLFIENDPEYEQEIRRVFDHMGMTIVPFSNTREWIQYFKNRGMKLYYLSNYSEEMFRQSKEVLSFLEEFDGGVFSWEEKCMKPDPKIYDILLSRYHIIPEKALFFDDLPKNIEGARKKGIQGIVFTQDIPLQMLKK